MLQLTEKQLHDIQKAEMYLNNAKEWLEEAIETLVHRHRSLSQVADRILSEVSATVDKSVYSVSFNSTGKVTLTEKSSEPVYEDVFKFPEKYREDLLEKDLTIDAWRAAGNMLQYYLQVEYHKELQAVWDTSANLRNGILRECGVDPKSLDGCVFNRETLTYQREIK
jgi:hypothetical protein